MSAAQALSVKKRIVELIAVQLKQDLELLLHSAKEAREAATHEESKAEDKYDTRGLEASYLAGAQARRAAEIQELIQAYRFMDLLTFESGAPIALTALVEVDSGGRKIRCFVVPRDGGKSIDLDGSSVQLVTPVSRLGEALIGRVAGDEFEVETAGQSRAYHILSVL